MSGYSRCRIVWFGRWEYPHNNCRHEALLERFDSVGLKRWHVSRSRYWRILHTLFEIYFLRPLVYPVMISNLAKRYRYLFCTELSQIDHFPGPIIVDDDDPDFTPNHISLLNRPNVVAVVTTSSLLRDHLREAGLQKLCLVLPSGVDLNTVNTERAGFIKRKMDKQGATLVVGFAAPRLYVDGEVHSREQKLRSVSFLCEVMELVWREEPHLQLWLLGEPSRGVVNYASTRPQVKLSGYVPHHDILNYVANFDVGVYPRTDGVGGRHSIKLLESMACGVPIVSTDVAESFIVKESGGGIVTSTVEQFADAVVRMARNRTAREQLGLAGRRFARDFDWDILAERYEREIFDIYCP